MDTTGGSDLSDDAVLGGRLKLLQPRRGHRVGHDAILLAAAADARPGELTVDLGAGVGAAGLALAARRPAARVALVEIDADLAALARANVDRNGLADRISVHVLDVEGEAAAFAAVGLSPGGAGSVLMNPPFNDPVRLAVSPDAGRRAAHVGGAGRLATWVATAARLLAADGVLTLIYRADALADVMAALDGFGALSILPVHPRRDASAIRVIVSTRKGSRAPLAVLPSLLLQDADGRPSAAAEAVLRSAQALPLVGRGDCR